MADPAPVLSASGARPPATCLIVDDEEAVRKFLATAVGKAGIVPSTAATPSEMANAIVEQTPGLIFLDASLGNSDAIEAMRLLAALDYRGPVQLMSGRAPDVLEDVRRIGQRRGLRMRPVLMKPFRLAQIHEVIRTEGLVGAGEGSSVAVDDSCNPDWLHFLYRPRINLRGNGNSSLSGDLHLSVPGVAVATAVMASQTFGDRSTAIMSHLGALARADAAQAAQLGYDLAATVRLGVDSLQGFPAAAIAGPKLGPASGLPILRLELDQDAVLADPELTQEVSAQLRLQGIAIVVGNVGTSYIAFVGHTPLPISEVRLDPTFVVGCSLPRNRLRTEKIIDIIHRAGSTVLADGVTERVDLTFLESIGCDGCQGPIVGGYATLGEIAAEKAAKRVNRLYQPPEMKLAAS